MDVNQNLHDALRVNGLNWEHVRDNLDIEDVSNKEHAAVKNFVSNVEDKSVRRLFLYRACIIVRIICKPVL